MFVPPPTVITPGAVFGGVEVEYPGPLLPAANRIEKFGTWFVVRS